MVSLAELQTVWKDCAIEAFRAGHIKIEIERQFTKIFFRKNYDLEAKNVMLRGCLVLGGYDADNCVCVPAIWQDTSEISLDRWELGLGQKILDKLAKAAIDRESVMQDQKGVPSRA